MKKYRNIIILVNLLLLLCFINWSVASKERTLANGKLVLFELAPVDPRSLMQGDYMNLRYRLTDSINLEEVPKRGFCVITPGEHGVAGNFRYQRDKTVPANGDVLIKYYYNDWTISVGAESYFFEEGKAEKFAVARYGGIRVDNNGNSVLQGLYDKEFRLIEP